MAASAARTSTRAPDSRPRIRPAARGGPVPQPVLPFGRVGRDDLLGRLVHVPGHDLGHVQRDGGDHLGVICLPGQFSQQPVGEASVPEPVGAQQRGQRRAALSLPARVFHRRGRGLHLRQVDPVLHDLKAGVDVAVDARTEQGQHGLVVAQLRDLPEYHLVDILVHRRGPVGHRRRDAGHQLGDRGVIDVHPRILTQACAGGTMPDPGFVTSGQWKNASPCLRSAGGRRS